MALATFIQWCTHNIILPGVALMNGNNTTEDYPPPTCHLPAAPPGNSFIAFLNDHWVLVILAMIGIVLSVGLILGVHHQRRKRLLKEQLEAGHIDQEQYDRLK